MVSMTINVPEGCPIQLVCTILMNRDIPNSHRPISQNVVFLDTQKPRRCPIKKKKHLVSHGSLCQHVEVPKSLGYP